MFTKTKSFLLNRGIPFIAKLGNQKHFSSIRDGFAIFTPILIAGSLAILFNQSIFARNNVDGTTEGTLTGIFTYFNHSHVTESGAYASFLTVMHMLFAAIQMSTMQVMSLYVAFAVAYFMASSRNNDMPVIAGLVGLASFLTVTPLTPAGSYAGWQGGTYWLSANGLISAIICALISAELFSWLSKGQKLAINMPQGVPPAVGKAFAKLFPAIITIGMFALVSIMCFWVPFQFTNKNWVDDKGNHIAIKMGLNAEQVKDAIDPNKVVVNKSTIYLPVSDACFTSVIFASIINPFIGAASSTGGAFGFAIAYVVLIAFFWFFGLHGTNIINGAFNPLWLILYAQNAMGAKNVFCQGTFDAYVFIGGWGVTLALVLATIAFGKKGSPEREISKFGLAPGLFNINEPVTFGYPLILNPILVIPLFLIMPVLCFTTWCAIGWWHWVPYTKTIMPWTTPVGFGGLIASGSFKGFALAIINLFIAFLLYVPFVIIGKMKANHDEQIAAEAKTRDTLFAATSTK